jgi:hypothetical protein
LANDKYKIADTKKLVERIQDLEKSLEINKNMLTTVLNNPENKSLVESEVILNLTDENAFVKKRLNQVYKENSELQNKILILEQITADFKIQEHMGIRQLEEQLREIREKMAKNETYMQSKEKKWLEIERIISEYAQNDSELEMKLRDIKFMIRADNSIYNVVYENESMERKCGLLQKEMNRLRQILLDSNK